MVSPEAHKAVADQAEARGQTVSKMTGQIIEQHLYNELSAAAEQARATLGRATKQLADFETDHNTLEAKRAEASSALETARAARLSNPEAAHLNAKVTAARDRLEAFSDAIAANLRAIEGATQATTTAKANLAAAEQALAPVKAERDAQMQIAHTARRALYDQALPIVRKLLQLFGADASTALVDILAADCTNPLPERFVEPRAGSIFAQMQAAQASSAPVDLMALMHPVTLKR